MSIVSAMHMNVSFKDYWVLCKPRVVALMLLTAIVGMGLATPGAIPFSVLFFATLGIGLASSAAAVINHLLDRHIDAVMFRTQRRPLPLGKVTPKQALRFAVLLALSSIIILINYVNVLTAILTFTTMIGYAVIYTVFLKRATPQNIVIGGIAGAMPPLLGWTAVTNHIDPYSLLPVLIIFVWTPPHFWALAIHRWEEYSAARVPMLPVTHGIPFTKLQILLYTVLLTLTSLLPYLTGMNGIFYLINSLVLNFIFIVYAFRLWLSKDNKLAMPAFYYSIIYLALLFCGWLIDHYFFVLV